MEGNLSVWEVIRHTRDTYPLTRHCRWIRRSDCPKLAKFTTILEKYRTLMSQRTQTSTAVGGWKVMATCSSTQPILPRSNLIIIARTTSHPRTTSRYKVARRSASNSKWFLANSNKTPTKKHLLLSWKTALNVRQLAAQAATWTTFQWPIMPIKISTRSRSLRTVWWTRLRMGWAMGLQSCRAKR